jgi:uncharacterized ion transporter superfamily protein YfcC
MKLILCLFLPVLCFAHVGDQAVYDLNVSDSTAKVTFSIVDKNDDDSTYTLYTMTDVNGEVTVEKEVLTEEDLMTTEKAVTIILLCMAIGGENVVINETDACKINTQSVLEMNLLDNSLLSTLSNLNTESVWIGDVPVHGIIRLETAENAIFTLDSFQYGE